MLNPSIEELDTFIRLMNDNDFSIFLTWLDKCMITQAGKCARETSDYVRVEQGKFLQLEELRKKFDRDKLEEALENLRRTKTNL